jgi:hypothetical protein
LCSIALENNLGHLFRFKPFIPSIHSSFLATSRASISISRYLVTLALPPLFSLTILACLPHLTCRYYILRSLTSSIDQERELLFAPPSFYFSDRIFEFYLTSVLGRPRNICPSRPLHGHSYFPRRLLRLKQPATIILQTHFYGF